MLYEPIEEFLARVRKLNKSNKDMRLSYDEAMALAIALGELMTRLNKEEGATQPTAVALPTRIDGGYFPKS